MAKEQIPFNWPLDEDGNPLELINTGALEKIPTVPYGNIEMWASVTKFVKNAEEAIDEQQEVVEKGLARKRAEIEAELEDS